ncbi:pilus assembly protein TadG-related protein [Solirhodobacter olei]|uniref:pilus assembly protein TadG-related protein n=1 Tax=Solirhodobacter olei TaxID=2493082 RepID=UPI000FDA1A85|nr:pilus assembly protein TadG-related protein [Solirhodobacter olei]
MRVLRVLAGFIRAEDGVFSTSALILMPILLFAAAVAIDMTSLEAEKRYVQAQADMAAMTAIRNFSSAETMRDMARETIAANTRYPTLPTPDSQIQIGALTNGVFTAAADQGSVAGQNAVRVVVRAHGLLYLLNLFVPHANIVLTRSAVAIQDPRVSFALSNCLLEANLLRPILEPLIGAQVHVLCSGRGIDTAISGQGFLDALSTQASLLTPSGSDTTYGDILDAELPVASVLNAALGVPVSGGGQTIRLGDVIYMSPDLRKVRVGQPLPPMSLNVSDIVLASAELLGKRVADVDTTLTLPSVGEVQAKVTIGDPRQIVLGAVPGDPAAVARTSQIRLDLPKVKINHLFELSLSVHLANASARLTDRADACSWHQDDVVADFDPVRASLADVRIGARVLGVPLNSSGVGQITDAVAPPTQQEITFTRYQAENDPVRTLGPTIGPDIPGLTSRVLGSVATILSSAQGGQGSSTGSRCANSLGCLFSSSLDASSHTLDPVLNDLSAAIPKIRAGTGVEGTAIKALINDVLGLGVAQAKLDLLYAGCPEPQRLAE